MRNLTLAGGLLLAGIAWQSGPAIGNAGQGSGPKGSVLRTAASQPPHLPYNHPMALLCRHYSTAAGTAAAEPKCSDVCAVPPDLEFLFVTVPDPERTHLGILFDRSMEAIIRAETNQNRVFDSYWLPWQLDTDIVERDPEKRKKIEAERQAREGLPGILFFRGARESAGGRRASDMAVFLIGESPSWGINKQQFEAALCYRDALRHSADPVNVAGPAFSGSIDSMIEATDPAKGHRFRVRSGTASSSTQGLRFQSARTDAGYASSVHTDDFALKAFREYLNQTLPGRYKIAILHENTEYGGDIEKDRKSEVIRISFPRDLSQLRNASQEEVDVNALSSAEGTQSPQQTLTLRLKDTQTGRDTIPVFAKDLAAVSQESSLLQIAAAIRREHVGYAGIAATNVLDVVYIANFLRKACPNTRLFILDADLLFAHEADRLQLEGMMSITTWPLLAGIDENVLARNEDEATESETVFSSRFEQGLYQAVQSFNDTGHPVRQRLWLTALGRDGYQPILFLDDKYAKNLHDPLGLLINGGAPRGEPTVLSTSPSYGWLSTALVFNLLGVAWLLICWHARDSNRRWCSDFNPRIEEPGYRGRAFFQLAATLSLAALTVTIGAAAWSLGMTGHIDWYRGILFIVIAIIVPPLLLMVWAARLTALVFRDVPKLDDPKSHVWRTAAVLAWVFLVIYLGVGCWLSTGNDAGTGAALFFNWRSLALGSRLSPIVPFLLLLPVFFGWGWVHLQRLLFVAERRPELLDCGGERHPSLKEIRELAAELNITLEEPFFAEPKWMLLVPSGIAVISFGLGLAAFKGFERSPYQLLFSVSVALACALVFSAWAHLLYAWSQLHNILEQLELHPIRYAFNGLPPEYSWSPIWQQSARKRSYKILSWSLDCMRALAKPEWAPPVVPPEDSAQLTAAANQMLDAAANGERESRADFNTVRAKLVTVAEALHTEVLEKRWKKGESELVRSAGSSDLTRRALRVRRAEMDRLKPELAAEEFVVLRYLHYIRYAMLQLRNLLTLISGGFILITLSLNSYPFQSVQMIRGMVTVSFVILGLGIVSMFVQMDRDAILSRITNTKAGKIGSGFYVRLITVGGLPLLTVLASHFPSIGRFLLSWVRPAMESMH
ncbi:MAG: hypothetical protein M3O35_16510 [Acidobacteriota bacterium]|nr:hypothetical protein [Acidobacteriota bacterium]